MAPKQKRGEATVDRVLTAALEVYGASGQQGFTVHAITAASGVSLGSLYHHFGSIDGLAAALYARCTEQLFDEMIAALRRTRTARTGVRALAVAYLRFTEEHADAARFLYSASHSGYLTADAERIRAVRAAKLAVIGEWIRPRVEAGEIAPLPDAVIEVLLIGPLAGAAHRWLGHPGDMDLAEAARILPDRIWRSLRPDGPAPAVSGDGPS